MGYSDGALSHCAIEMDLGSSMPVDQIELFRSRYIQNGLPFKLFQDLGWRYMIVLDEGRKIVAWEAFNVYKGDYLKKKGHWRFVPERAEGGPAGRLVPEGSRSWLSEAEYIRDFLGKPVTDLANQLTDEDRACLARFKQRNDPTASAGLRGKWRSEVSAHMGINDRRLGHGLPGCWGQGPEEYSRPLCPDRQLCNGKSDGSA
ncbi:MAG: hypothetical protein R6V06_03150 [Kiritimatiellia bacterium]